jgi:Uma2 family endonuclease
MMLQPSAEIEYPCSDGTPVGETPEHRDNLLYLVDKLRRWLADDPQAYVSGNTFLYYERGNPRRHVSPDVFVVRGIVKAPERRRYLMWEEGKGPDLVIELTSTSTVEEDLEGKFALYRDVLRVQEYFLFDPLRECLDPPLQGFRLRKKEYAPIRPVKKRLPSKVLGLHLEPDDWQLRLYAPATQTWVPTPPELRQAYDAQHEVLETQRRVLEAQRQTLETQRQALDAERQARAAAEAEIRRLQKELKKRRGGRG